MYVLLQRSVVYRYVPGADIHSVFPVCCCVLCCVVVQHSIVGYCAHWRESLADPDTKIIRPQQDYRGVWLRHYVPMAERVTAAPKAGKPMAPDAPALQRPGNAYRRRVAGDNWV
jgi:hypothetical protein